MVVVLNPGTGGKAVSTDTVAGEEFQEVKMVVGADGVATGVSSTAPFPVDVYFPDTQQLDGFGRLRVGEPQTVFDSKQVIDNRPLLWDEAASGGASASTHSIPRASSLMALGTASGEKIIRQTKRYFNYQPGKSMLVVLTAIMQPKTNVRQRVGYFDDGNGIFFEHDGVTAKVVVRTKTSGTAVDATFDQSDWNTDKMDGFGPSGITVDFSKSQIFIMDFQWLGVGRVRFSLSIDGVTHTVHDRDRSNVIDVVYMSTPDLPVRYEIENTGIAADATTLEQLCSSLTSEGGYNPDGIVHGFTMQNGTGRAFGSSSTPVMSMRLSTAGIRAHVELLSASVLLLSKVASIYRILVNPTIGAGTAPTWVAADAFSNVEIDIARTGSVTGGVLIGGGQISSEERTTSRLVASELTLTSDIAGVSDEIVLCCQTASTGSPTGLAEMFWKEIS